MFNKQEFNLRLVNSSDEEIIFHWRNQERIRRNMYTDNLISQEEHHQWFCKTLKDSSKVYLICELKNTSIGLVYFTSIDQKNSKCDWGFYLGEEECVRGSGFVMEFMALNHVFDEIKIRKLCCEVFVFNTPVIKQHKRFGFEEEGVLKKHILKNDQYHDVVKLALFKEKWEECKDNIDKKYFSPPA
jgi:UDP-4-amino-4,6-dideoxy-N-acetyl-beta-L-altrosamine N-acetyltransferase